MTLLDYLKQLPDDSEREAFASRCETTHGYLKQVAYRNKNCGESLAINIDRESAGAVPCEELCPDVDWEYVRTKQADTSHTRRVGDKEPT